MFVKMLEKNGHNFWQRDSTTKPLNQFFLFKIIKIKRYIQNWPFGSKGGNYKINNYYTNVLKAFSQGLQIWLLIYKMVLLPKLSKSTETFREISVIPKFRCKPYSYITWLCTILLMRGLVCRKQKLCDTNPQLWKLAILFLGHIYIKIIQRKYTSQMH